MVEESSQVTCPITTKLVLDEDEETKEPILQVHKNLVTKLKPHQVDGTKKFNLLNTDEQLCVSFRARTFVRVCVENKKI